MEISTVPDSLPKTHRNDMLKIIAILTMLIDHTGYLFFPHQMIFRTIGRIAFPIFAYQIAIGFQKTSSRKKYALRLFLFACISQIPYFWFNPKLDFEWGSLNIMFTLLLALGVLQTFEMAKTAFKEYTETHEMGHVFKGIGFAFLSMPILIAPEITQIKFNVAPDYGSCGILFVLLFYFLGKRWIPLIIGYITLSAGFAYYQSALWSYLYAGTGFFEALFDYKAFWTYQVTLNNNLYLLQGAFFQSRSFMALPIIWIMNYVEQLGIVNIRLNKYVGYFFYPVHIAVLLGIKFLIR
jgi:hypothetical protein